ncbi:hypothetical protein [Cryptosporangium aurantiacum]|uniref:Uncharacterized protein n=1 Tax=Cryptosporangium aurantiacum TaxID=134849 RepID=A0A1M7NQS0_9ACTN|nr:hypothetical protein [Cryptosporangium aurantiacum]SHN05756.1 hypothetical protein SAMN05443668_102758 [Cryptosporangium aurantiacum]
MSTPPIRRPRVTLWLLRLGLTVHALCVVAQPVLAGRFLDGDYDAISAHSLNGSVLPASGMLVGAVALAYLIAGGAVWPLLAFSALWLAEGFQIGAGYARVLAIHIPLGVAIVVAALGLTIWSWLPAAARPRRGRQWRMRREPARAALDRVAAEAGR